MNGSSLVIRKGMAMSEIRYLYWFVRGDFEQAKSALEAGGYRLSQTLLTPCQVLKSVGKKLVYAPPAVWSRICVRQGSWYRNSNRNGKYMLMSDHRLPEEFNSFLDSKMKASDFLPENLPSSQELETVINSREYQDNKPAKWENIGLTDAVMFKSLFTVTGFWGRGDNLHKHWLTHKANNANFLSHSFTVRMGDEEVPYSISENSGICSSCVEFFNIIDQKQRKLVRACPGAAIFGGAEKGIYYDLKPSCSIEELTHNTTDEDTAE
jgi:hypothetical protein